MRMVSTNRAWRHRIAHCTTNEIRRCCVVAAVTGAAATTPCFAQNLVFNGSFTTSAIGWSPINWTPANWQLSFGTIPSGVGGYGGWFLLNNTSTAVAETSQLVSGLEPGALYRLRGFFRRESQNFPNAQFQALTDSTVQFAAGGNVGAGWIPFSADFVADDADVLIRFRSQVGGDDSHGIDNIELVRVSCVADITGDGNVGVSDLLSVISAWGPCPVPCPPVCPADVSRNCQVSVGDLLAVINGWGQCPVGACALPSNTCSVTTQAECWNAGGRGWVGGSGGSCVDTDGDRIPNAFELNNCSPAALAYVGTDPTNPDTDGDGLNDGDEFYGTTSGLQLPFLGCNPLRKNLLMEVDWFDDSAEGPDHSHRPSAAAVSSLIAAFANSPVTNVCGPTGITLIVDYGQGGNFFGGNLIPGGDTIVLFDSEFNAYKAANFAANRNGYFYYAIHCHRYDAANNNSSGVAEINGDDHIVSLQTFLSDSNVSKTMMHEFGHNLGLRHGGFENLNFKPNYNSVMNYRYQLVGIDNNCDAVGDGVLDYSIGARISLNENSLQEGAGVCGFGAVSPIDWNQSGGINGGAIARNIKCSAGNSEPCGSSSNACCGNDCSRVCQVLQDYNDWANISFAGLMHFDFGKPEIVTCHAQIEPVRNR